VQRVLLRLQGPPGPASAGAFVAARLEAERLRGEAALLSAELTLPCESFLLTPLKLLKVRAPPPPPSPYPFPFRPPYCSKGARPPRSCSQRSDAP